MTAVFVTSYLMLGLQLAAKDLENPFGYDLSDLDLDAVRLNLRFGVSRFELE